MYKNNNINNLYNHKQNFTNTYYTETKIPKASIYPLTPKSTSENKQNKKTFKCPS